ncbi:MAG: hypothetical protein GYA61_05710 [Spirochaetales bacterium]|nr:hypothetical protein [Spirochaetales bacterium]
MLYYILGAILFLIIIIVYYLLISKSKSVVDTSIKINDAMGNYFILLSNFEKIIKENDSEAKKEKVLQLKLKAEKYCEQYPKSIYRKEIEKLIEKLIQIEKSMQ